MTSRGRAVAAVAMLLLLAGCGFGTKRTPYNYGPYVTSNPRSVLVAPVAGYGKSPDWFLATIAQPLAERGYYVMPVRMSRELMALEGFSAFERETTGWYDMDAGYGGTVIVDKPEDAAQIKEMAIELAAFSGADSVLFVQIVSWNHEVNHSEGYFSNMVDEKMDHSVGLDYQLVDDRGETLWRAKKHLVYTRGGGNVFVEIWNTNVKPTDDEIDTALARDANRVMIEGLSSKTKAVWYYPTDPMLVGPYHSGYEHDRARRLGN